MLFFGPRPGVTRITHTGIYLGGKLFIHCAGLVKAEQLRPRVADLQRQPAEAPRQGEALQQAVAGSRRRPPTCARQRTRDTAASRARAAGLMSPDVDLAARRATTPRLARSSNRPTGRRRSRPARSRPGRRSCRRARAASAASASRSVCRNSRCGRTSSRVRPRPRSASGRPAAGSATTIANRPMLIAQNENLSSPSFHVASGRSARRQNSIRPMPSMP